MPIEITIRPTELFFMYAGMAVRVWEGRFADGERAEALIAAVSCSKSMTDAMIGMTPIPPPSETWSPHVRYRMQRVWQLGDRLTAKEAGDLAELAEAWVASREQQQPAAPGAEARRLADGTTMAPLVPEPQDAVLRRAGKALGEDTAAPQGSL